MTRASHPGAGGGGPTPLPSRWTRSEPPQTHQVAPGGRGGQWAGRGGRWSEDTKPARPPHPRHLGSGSRCRRGSFDAQKREEIPDFSLSPSLAPTTGYPGACDPEGSELRLKLEEQAGAEGRGTLTPAAFPPVLWSRSHAGQCSNPNPSPLAGEPKRGGPRCGMAQGLHREQGAQPGCAGQA